MTDVSENLQLGPRYNSELERAIRYSLFDIDNTLIANNSPELPTERFLSVARIAGEKALIGVATARPLQTSKHIIHAARMSGLSILSNGAQIYDGQSGRFLVERVMPQDSLFEIVRTLQLSGIEHWVQDDGIDYRWIRLGAASKIKKESNNLGAYTHAKGSWPTATAHNVQLVSAYKPVKPLVLVAHKVTREQADNLIEIGQQYKDENITSLVAHETIRPDGTKLYEVFFLDARANKKEAMQIAAQLSGIDIEAVMATGDGPNDTFIVESAGIGVAMGNSVAQTKRVASYIAPSREQDGARVALEQLIIDR